MRMGGGYPSQSRRGILWTGGAFFDAVFSFERAFLIEKIDCFAEERFVRKMDWPFLWCCENICFESGPKFWVNFRICLVENNNKI